jgi:spermidine synthase
MQGPSEERASCYLDRNPSPPYRWLKKNPEVLTIGLGGGSDVATALHYEAKKIYGIEISQRMIEVVRDEFRSFLNSPYQHPRLEIIHDEGRSLVRRLEGKVDLIQMTGVDTMTARFGGNFVMAENFIYTVESFREMFQHVRDNGIFCIVRASMHPVFPTGFRIVEGQAVSFVPWHGA